MFEKHTEAVRGSLDNAIALSTERNLGILMLEYFFEKHPEAQKLFSGTNIPNFAARKFWVVSELLCDSIKNPEYALYMMVSEIQRHRYFDVQDSVYYYAIMDGLQHAIKTTLKDAWNAELETLWDESLQAAKNVIQGAIKEVSDD